MKKRASLSNLWSKVGIGAMLLPPLFGGLGHNPFTTPRRFVLIDEERYEYLLKIEQGHALMSKRLDRLRKKRRKK